MLRDHVGRFAKSGFLRKTIKYGVVLGVLWFTTHLFLNQYMFVFDRGVYGVVSKATYNAQIDDHAKAQGFDTLPDYSQLRAIYE